MRKEDIDKILPCFRSCGCRSPYKNGPQSAKWYYHKESDFGIMIFDNDEVYQSGTEADIIGIELTTYEKLIERYESFTGEKLDDYDHTLDQVYEDIDKFEKIREDYFKFKSIELELKEESLVFLYKYLIDLKEDKRQCELFLEFVEKEFLSVDVIVHIWNALSPIKEDIQNWDHFVSITKQRLIDMGYEKEIDELLSVIL